MDEKDRNKAIADVTEAANYFMILARASSLSHASCVMCNAYSIRLEEAAKVLKDKLSA